MDSYNEPCLTGIVPPGTDHPPDVRSIGHYSETDDSWTSNIPPMCLTDFCARVRLVHCSMNRSGIHLNLLASALRQVAGLRAAVSQAGD